MYFPNHFMVVDPFVSPLISPSFFSLSTAGSRCFTRLLATGRERPRQMASSTDRYCSSMPAPHSLPHHLLPPCSSLRRSSLALNGSTTACKPPTTLPRRRRGPNTRIERCRADRAAGMAGSSSSQSYPWPPRPDLETARHELHGRTSHGRSSMRGREKLTCLKPLKKREVPHHEQSSQPEERGAEEEGASRVEVESTTLGEEQHGIEHPRDDGVHPRHAS